MVPERLALQLDAEAWAEQDAHDAAAEYEQQERWREFVASCSTFANLEGWPATIAALAEAMRQQQQDAAEVEKRR